VVSMGLAVAVIATSGWEAATRRASSAETAMGARLRNVSSQGLWGEQW
jgi:hypothetical protein